jgi:hypothetical protein
MQVSEGTNLPDLLPLSATPASVSLNLQGFLEVGRGGESQRPDFPFFLCGCLGAAKASLPLETLCLRLPRAGITGVHCCTWCICFSETAFQPQLHRAQGRGS